jgi:hypothetical protein
MNIIDNFIIPNTNIDYGDIINKLQHYMLTERLIESSIEHKIQKSKDEKPVKSPPLLEKEKEKDPIIFPREKDSLFWCFYIMKNGEASYEMIDFKSLIIEKKIKIEYVERLRKEKQLIKTYKFATLTHIENQLANEQRIDIKTFLTLCVLENLNIIYINKNTYFELLMNDTSKIYLIKKKNQYNSSNNIIYTSNFGYKMENKESEEIMNYKNKLFKIDNIDKPIKAISSYKLQDLIDFCIRLNIETINNETKKNKNKNELYESLIQYF